MASLASMLETSQALPIRTRISLTLKLSLALYSHLLVLASVAT